MKRTSALRVAALVGGVGILFVLSSRAEDLTTTVVTSDPAPRAGAALPQGGDVGDDVSWDAIQREPHRKDLAEGRLEVLIPALRGRTTQSKLRTLRWWLQVPGSKIVSLFPDLNQAHDRPIQDRHEVARARIELAIGVLQQEEGFRAPHL